MIVPLVSLSSVRIRPYRVDEAEKVFAIFSAHADITQKKSYLGFRTPLLEPNGMMLVAEEAGQIVAIGGLVYIEEGRIAILHTDGVMPTHEKRGIGTAVVMARLAAVDEELGCELVSLLATELSRGFYERFGFAAVGAAEFDPTQGFQLVGMELPFSVEIRRTAVQWLADSHVSIDQTA